VLRAGSCCSSGSFVVDRAVARRERGPRARRRGRQRESQLAMEFAFLRDLVLVLGVSVASVFLLGKIKLPSLPRFLLAGVIVGPHGLRLIAGVHEVERLAEVGAVFLLFSVGVDFSLDKLVRIRREVMLGGSLQVLLTGAAFALLALAVGQPL